MVHEVLLDGGGMGKWGGATSCKYHCRLPVKMVVVYHRPISSGSTTCTATYGSGAGTGTELTHPCPSRIRLDRRQVRQECCAAAPHWTSPAWLDHLPGTVAPRMVAGGCGVSCCKEQVMGGEQGEQFKNIFLNRAENFPHAKYGSITHCRHILPAISRLHNGTYTFQESIRMSHDVTQPKL